LIALDLGAAGDPVVASSGCLRLPKRSFTPHSYESGTDRFVGVE
jgi:hypothetical protein